MTSKFITIKYNFRNNSCSFIKTNQAQKKLHSVNSFIILLPVTDLSFQIEINKVKFNFFGSKNKSAIDSPTILYKNELIIKSKKSKL